MARWEKRLLSTAIALPLCGCGQPAQAPGGRSDTAAAGFAPCQSCHSAGKDSGSRVGPNLYGVIGRKAGTVADYRYSNAMRDSGIVWTREALDRFLAAPAQTVPGTRMNTAFPDEARRRAAIEYLSNSTK